MVFSRFVRNNKKRLWHCRGKDVPPFRVLETTNQDEFSVPDTLGVGTALRNAGSV